jgi:hypothetical protein
VASCRPPRALKMPLSTRMCTAFLLAAVTAALGASSSADVAAPGRSAWAHLPAGGGDAAINVVTTNAPVLRWASKVQSGGTFAYTVTVVNGSSSAAAVVWTSGEVWQGNWPAHAPAFPGLCVYEGPPLARGAIYSRS